MTSTHEFFTAFIAPLRDDNIHEKPLYQVRQHDMIVTKWDFDKLLSLPETTLVYSWGYDEEDVAWEDDDTTPINLFLYRIGGLQYLLKDMDVPAGRIRDLKWLQQNLWSCCYDHPNYNRARAILNTAICY